MTVQTVAKMAKALSALHNAVEAAARAAGPLSFDDTDIKQRMSSYKEVIRRQALLLQRLSSAAAANDWQAVTRITDLVRTSSLMLQTDAEFIIDHLRQRRMARRAA